MHITRVTFVSAGPPRARADEPVRFGVPLPAGCAAATSTFTFDGPDGPRPADFDVLDRWPDGSVRWLLVSTNVSAPAGGSGPHVLQVDGNAAADRGLTLDEGDGRITVDTGVCRFVFGTGLAWPLLAVERDEDGFLPLLAEGSGLTVAGLDGARYPVTTHAVSVRRAGRVWTTIAASGAVALPAGRRLDVEWTIDCHAHSPVLACAVTIRNPHRAVHEGNHWELGDAGSVLLDDVSVRVALAAQQGGSLHAACSPEPGLPMAPVSVPFHLYQDSSGGEHWQSLNHVNRDGRVPVRFRGYRQTGQPGDGLRATPLVTLSAGAHTIAVATRHFWENFPKALAIEGGTIRLGLFPGEWDDQHELQGGEQKTHAFAVSFGPDGITADPLSWWREPLVAVIDPADVARSGAVPYVTTGTPDAATEIYARLQASAIAGDDSFAAKRERIDEYGWRHFGDIYGDHEAVRSTLPTPLVSHYNNQYDPVLGLARQFLQTGDTRWWTAATELAGHVVDIDLYHTSEDKAAYNGGLFWHTVHYIDAERSTHRSYPKAPGSPGGGPASEQNYTSGLALQYFLTGDPAFRDAAIGLAEFVLHIDDGSRTVFRWLAGGATGLASASGNELYHGPGRGPGNSVNALLDGFRLTRERRFLLKAEELIRRCVHPAQDIHALTLLDAERRWYYTMFLQSLGKYLDLKVELDELDGMYDYGRRSLVRFAEWMVEHERPTLDHPEILEFPTETWAAQDIRKCDVLNYASLHATGDMQARFRDRARFFFEYATATLPAMPTHTLCRPVVVLLTSGLTHAWCQEHAGASGPMPREQWTPAPHPVFVPQKARALRRAKRLVLLGAAAAVLGLMALVVLLVA